VESEQPKSERVAQFVERWKFLVLAALTAIYAMNAASRAAARPFWYDEIITLVAARQPDLSTALKAAGAMDAVNPPLPHFATYFAIRWFGLSEVTARLPVIAGFWVYCLCIYCFVARRKGPLIGLSALLLPVVTEALLYATEARAYGLVLGFCGVLLVAWQAAAEGRRRTLALIAIAIATAGMLMCHYYAALVYLPLGAGELVRARRKRRIDWGVAMSMAVGAAPLAWHVFAIMGAINTFAHGWASAYLRQGLEFWQTALGTGAPWLALLVGILALSRIRGIPHDTGDQVPEHEWVAAALFLAIPLVDVIAALMVTHAFTPRYALIGLTGVFVLMPLLAAEFGGARSTAAVAMAAVLGWGALVTLIDHGDPENPFAQEPVLGQALEQGDVVVSDGQLFLQMWQYAPQRLKSRLVFVVDDAAAIRYMGFNTIDAGIRPVALYAPMSVIEYADFIKRSRDFLLYRNLLRPEWITPRMVDMGASIEVQKLGFRKELVRVRQK
jgi:hypothetical protein